MISGCSRQGCGADLAHYLNAIVPAWGWPVIVGAYLGGVMLTARLLFLSEWAFDGDGQPIGKHGSLALGIAWPLWVPLRYLGILAAATWRGLVRLVLGDLEGEKTG